VGAGAASVGAATLFFGCRSSEEDYIFHAQLEDYLADGTLAALHLAFSRERPESGKVYVQHRLRERGAELFAALEGAAEGSGAGAGAPPAARRAHVYVCGATRMGADVLQAFEEIVERGLAGGGAGPPSQRAAAAAYVKRMQAEGRYVQELWQS
jgi:sulfite reductase alpha subunit-like flavoprotein